MTAPKRRDGACEGNACCEWRTFREGFEYYWARFFVVPPTDDDWKAAVRDWRAGNTGFEAAHNAMRRAKDAAEIASRPRLLHLGGRNYCYEGSALARVAAPTSPTPAQEGKT